MGTLPRLFVFAAVIALTFSQDIFQMVPQSEPVWFEIGGLAQVDCKWEQSFGDQGQQVVEWKTKIGGIKKITRDNEAATYVYKNTPISEDRLNVVVDWEGQDEAGLIVQMSTLSFTDVKVTDPQNFTCEVEIGQEQHSTTSRIMVYAIPTISMHDIVVTADMRKPVEPVAPDYPDIDVNGTEAVNGTEDVIVEGTDEGIDAGALEPSRKRRQISEDATLDENPPTDSTQLISVSCSIEGAYPKPTNLVFVIGESDTMDPSQDVAWTQDPETKLWSGTAMLEMPADPMYDKKSVSVSLTLPTQPARQLESSNTSNPFEILHETTRVSTTVSPDIAVEGDTVQIECHGDGNPAPTFSLKSDNPDIAYAADEAGTKFHIRYVGRNHEGFYWCEASSDDRSNPEAKNIIESDNKAYLEVQYIDAPTLSRAKVVSQQGNSEIVQCTAKGNPSPDLTWNKNGMYYSSGAMLRLSDIKYSDAGQYECVIKNVAGTRSDSLDVEVEGKCNIQFEEPVVAGSPAVENTYFIKLKCITSGNPECQVNIVAQNGFDVQHKTPVREGGTVTLEYPSVPMLTAPVKFACVASNAHTKQYNRTVTVGESSMACCTAAPHAGGISTGAIVGILLLVLVIIVGIPVACYCVKKRNSPSTKKAPTDAEGGAAEKEGLHKEASSEDSDTGSLPPPPADDIDPRMNNSHEMTTFSTNQ